MSIRDAVVSIDQTNNDSNAKPTSLVLQLDRIVKYTYNQRVHQSIIACTPWIHAIHQTLRYLKTSEVVLTKDRVGHPENKLFLLF